MKFGSRAWLICQWCETIPSAVVYAALVAVAHPVSWGYTMAKHRRLERRWISSGRISNREEFRRCCRNTSRLIKESRRQLVSSRLAQCVNARQRLPAVRKLLHDDNKSAWIDDDVSFCNMFANTISSWSCMSLLCNYYNLLPLSRYLNFFQPFHQNLVVELWAYCLLGKSILLSGQFSLQV